MKKVKVRIKQKDNRINVTYFYNKQLCYEELFYLNTCKCCKKTLLGLVSFDDNYVCYDCLKKIRDILDNQPLAIRAVKKEDNKPKLTITYPKHNMSISSATKDFRETVQIVDFIEYQNLMNKRINEKTANVIVTLILNGYNTATKIGKKIKSNNYETIYNYLSTMAKVGILCPVDKKSNGAINKMFKLHPELVYTRVKGE